MLIARGTSDNLAKDNGMNDMVSVFEGISPIPNQAITWQEAIRLTKEGRFKAKIEHVRSVIHDIEEYRRKKKQLPGVTFCGTFKDNRDQYHVLLPSGFIVADFDHVENVDEVFDILCNDERIWFAFKSPSGHGIKCGLRAHGINTDADIKVFYEAISDYFLKVYNLDTDPSCKDIARLTFLSSDPDAFVNEDALWFNIESWMAKSAIPVAPASSEPIPCDPGTGKQKYAMKVLESSCGEIRCSQPGNQHHVRMRMSFLVGGYSHYLPDGLPWRELESAVAASGAKNMVAAMKDIAHGLKNGAMKPIDIPQIGDKSDKSDKSDSGDSRRHLATLGDTWRQQATLGDSERQAAEINLVQEIKDWVVNSEGWFTAAQVDTEFALRAREERKHRSKILNNLVREGLLKKDRQVKGRFCALKNDIEFIDLDAVEESNFPIVLPLGLSEMVSLPAGIAVLAGGSNAGKTAFLLSLLRLNLSQDYPLYYLMSEMGPSEYKQRLRLFGDDMTAWKKVRAASRSAGFDGVIKAHNAHGLTVVDYLEEIDGEYFKINSAIRDIYDALHGGLCWVALQKKSGSVFGRGGEATQEKARLYLALDQLCHEPGCTICSLKIVKAKCYIGDNPNGKEIHFRLIRGANIEPITDWRYFSDKEREQAISKYKFSTHGKKPLSDDDCPF